MWDVNIAACATDYFPVRLMVNAIDASCMMRYSIQRPAAAVFKKKTPRGSIIQNPEQTRREFVNASLRIVSACPRPALAPGRAA